MTLELVGGRTRFCTHGPALAARADLQGRLWALCHTRPATLCGFDPLGQPLASFTVPDGRPLDVQGDTAAVGHEAQVTLICLASGRTLATLACDQHVQAVRFGPEGALAVGTEHGLEVWDGATRRWVVAQAHQRDLWCVAWSPDGRRLATGGWDHRVRLWDAHDGGALAEGETNNVRAVTFSPDGGWVYTGGGSGRVHRWTANALAMDPGFTLHHEFEAGGDAGVQSVVALDGALFTWANDRTVRRWEGTEEIWRARVGEILNGTHALSPGPDGALLVAGPMSSPVLLSRDDGRRLLDPLPAATHGALSMRGAAVVASGQYGGELWQDGQRVTGGGGVMIHVQGEGLFAAGQSRRHRLAPDLTLQERTPTDSIGVCHRPLATAAGLVAVPEGRHVELWRRGCFEGRLAAEQEVTSVAIGPDARWLALTEGQALEWWWLDPRPARAARIELPMRAWPGAIGCAISPDGALVAVTDPQGVTLWRTEDGQAVDALEHPDCGGVTFLGPDRVAVAAGGTLLSWTPGAAPLTLGPATTARVERRDGWPLASDPEAGALAFFGAEGNIWRIGTDFQRATPTAEPPRRPAPAPDSLEGTVWHLSGTFGMIHRDAAEARIVELGGTIARSVTRKLTHLAQGRGGSEYSPRQTTAADRKAQDAIARGQAIEVMCEATMLHMLHPDLDTLKRWTPQQRAAWRAARPSGGFHLPLPLPALRGASWPGADLKGADLRHVDLTGADLTDADLSGIQGEEAKLSRATLRGATLSGASLYRAEMTDADLTGADLRGAQLYEARLEGCRFDGALTDERTQWPRGFSAPENP